jgi:hypothetical protein
MTKMINNDLTNEQKINLDYINGFYLDNKPIHIELLRVDYNGRHIFLNGILNEKISDTLFIIKERRLGNIRVSLFEIKDNGISEFRGKL